MGGEAALYRATDLLIHLVKRKFICPLRAIMLAEGRSIDAVFILNSSLKNSCYPELWLHQRTLFKMWQTFSSNLYGNFVCQASCGKTVLFKMCYKNATVIVFSWVASLGEDNWDNVKKSSPTPFSQPGDLPTIVGILASALLLAALFSLFSSVQSLLTQISTPLWGLTLFFQWQGPGPVLDPSSP